MPGGDQTKLSRSKQIYAIGDNHFQKGKTLFDPPREDADQDNIKFYTNFAKKKKRQVGEPDDVAARTCPLQSSASRCPEQGRDSIRLNEGNFASSP